MVQQLTAVLPYHDLAPVYNWDFSQGKAGWFNSNSGEVWTVTGGISRFEKGTATGPAYLGNYNRFVGLPTGMVMHGQARVNGAGRLVPMLIDDGWYTELHGSYVSFNAGWQIIDFWFPASQGSSTNRSCRLPVVWFDSPNLWFEVDWVRISVEPGGQVQYLANNSFDTNTSSWAGDGAGSTLSWVSGGYARLVPGTSPDPYMHQVSTGDISSGTVSGRARVRGKGTIGCHLRTYAGAANWGTYVPFDTGTTWTEVDFVSPVSNGTNIIPWVVISVDKAGGSSVEVDWVSLVPTVDSTWPVAADGDMVCDPASGRVMLFSNGSWRELTATMAYQLATARTFSLTGSVSGSVATDLSGNVSMPTDVLDYGHYHQLGVTWGYFSGSLGCVNNGQQIPWSASQVSGPGVTGPGHTGNSIRFGKAGWWFYGVTAQMNDQTGAGKTALEANGTHYSIMAANHDSAGRWGGMAGGFVYSGGGDTITPYFNVGSVQQICSFAMFFGVWMRP